MACKSACGFQSESYKTHVSADWRLIPRPPARVVIRNKNNGEHASLKALTLIVLLTRFVAPVNLQNGQPAAGSNHLAHRHGSELTENDTRFCLVQLHQESIQDSQLPTPPRVLPMKFIWISFRVTE